MGAGKIFVIDGLDGSGKSTQAQIITDKLKSRRRKVKFISFPDYNEPSSALVRMYLNGELSQNPDDINAYAASSFYAVDRYASYKKYWEKDYLEGAVIIAGRYVSSNLIHQMGKLPENEWNYFIKWLNDYEYNKLGLPRPEKVIYLNMPRKAADLLLMERYGGDGNKKDIHEKNKLYLEKCQKAAEYAIKADNWVSIECGIEDKPFPLDIITDKIMEEINL